ncbi:MAG TPA: flavin reductase family protein [Gaiellaceae bacterium]|nr:flavin reductase family protein [Gaiellaceae bacterium]
MIGAVATGDDLRALMRRLPAPVAVATVDAYGQRLGLTVSSLVSLSLEPPIVGVSISQQAAMHELLREAGGFTLSLLAAGQEPLAQHFARGVPPIALWEGIATEAGTRGAPRLAGALGWIECRLAAEHATGDHTLFVGEVLAVQRGADAPPLVHHESGYRSL